MIFNIVFGIWSFLLTTSFLLIFLAENNADNKKGLRETEKIFWLSLIVSTIMAIISKFV